MTNRAEEGERPEPASLVLEEWGRNPFYLPNEDEPVWRFGVGRQEASGIQLCAVFSSDKEDCFPRGYLQSLEQRFELLRKVVPASERDGYALKRRKEGGIEIWCPYFEGESLLSYFRDRKAVSDDLSFELIGDLVDVLIRFVKTPRLLSGLSFEDFYVSVRDGIRLETKVFPVPSLLRSEVPLSDYQMAKRWIEMIARIFLAIRGNWAGELSSYDPYAARPFRKLLREISQGRERSLVDRMVDLRKVVYSGVSGSVRARGIGHRFTGRFPLGGLSEHFIQSLAKERPDSKVVQNSSDGRRGGFSQFVFEIEEKSEEGRVCYIAPPDEWVGEPAVDTIHRKMSHSFLHAHHNGVRIRSVLCQENCTVLLTDPLVGMPLPVLFRFRGGLRHDEFMFLFQKIHRALGAFESAEFQLNVISPWQVQFHLEECETSPNWVELLALDIREWPSWDVRIRVEAPMEALLPSQNAASWAHVFEELGRKCFPALVCWALDWERFELAYDTGTIRSEPLSRDERFDALFHAARKFLEATDSGQRENFLRMVDEGVRGILEEQARK